jgi:formylglycine-generating enzyme required for sulfatase activity
MRAIIKPVSIFFVFLFFLAAGAYSQVLHNVVIANTFGLSADQIVLSDSSSVIMARSMPLYSFRMNGRIFNSSMVNAEKEGEKYSQSFENELSVTFQISDSSAGGWNGEIIFENRSEDTISIGNIVPFGENNNSVYITAEGPPDLARAKLFRPGYRPVRVILPDNAWELGYASFFAGYELSVCALSRRTGTEGGQIRRYETRLPSKASVSYFLHADVFGGEWQNGLRIMFRDRYIYDVERFDNFLYGRKDLAWIRQSYIIVLQMAWDREFYDRFTGKYTYADVIKKGIDLFGKIDVYGLWPTWPRLGLDQRNQWDMYRDLPGGIQQVRNIIKVSQMSDTKFFIAYNPWDISTRKEDHYSGLARLIADTEPDGVILDTMGSSGSELQRVADSVKKGVVMYSEGMAIPKNMPGILSGRVHNAIFLSPELNLNKFIKPDFSIFRVCDVGEDIIHREVAIAFFNGYGTELNMFRPGGRDDNYRNDLSFLSHTTFVLRQNNDAFLDTNWTPLIETLQDNVFVNSWKSGDKTIFTVLNMREDGISGKLFRIDSTAGRHYLSLWNHENIVPVTEKGKTYLPVNAEGWHASFSGTRSEGSIDCIAELPLLIDADLKGDSLRIHHKSDGELVIWKGNPSYQTPHKDLILRNDTTIRVKDIFGFYEGKIVLQLTENKILKDEKVLFLKGGKPWIISEVIRTERAASVPSEMVVVPGSALAVYLTPPDDFIPYPEVNLTTKVDSFLIDKFSVTNAQFYDFITNTGYRPADTARFLRHWQSGTFRQGQDKYPVVYVSFEDIEAYTRWAGKRLPTQAEWQLAAQGTDSRKWPWGNDFHGTLCNNAFDKPTPVDAFPKGQSPYGVVDLVGNVWQVTNDIYFNGTNYFTVIRGGSYYKPESSWWYVQGGPQSLDRTQIMLMVSPGFDRCATVGFRCVKDIDTRNFKVKQ